jgi:hypothetical protein
MIFTWTPASSGTPVIFSRDATDYQLLLDYTGFAGIPGEHVYADKAPMRHGQIRKYTTLTKRELSFDIMILSDDLTEQQALVTVLSSALNPLDGPGILQYTKEDNTTYYLNAIGVSGNPSLSPTDKSSTHQKATIKLVADEDPFWHADSPSIEYFNPTPANYFPFPNGTGTWPWSLSSLNKIKTCVNAGSVDAPIIVIFTGPMTNPVLICTKTVDGVVVTETLSLTITMIAADTLIVNTDPDIMTARYYPAAGGDLNAHKYVDTDAILWQLGRGSNTVELDPDTSSTGALASVQWSDRYVGI